jgi:hypothetical protein
MDITSINPSAHADQDEFPVGKGKFVHLPFVAKGQSVTAAARKLAKGLDLGEEVVLPVPENEAMAIAASVVDPTALRLDLERKRVSYHRTPSGHELVSVEARVWAAGVSCDGANGRGVFDAKYHGEPVWPLPEEGTGEPTMRYVTQDIDNMRAAVRHTAERIANPEMRMLLRQHPRGVWNPIYVVPGCVAIKATAEGDIESESAFAHTAEGSTRLVTCQEGIQIARDLPLQFAGNTLDLVRRVRAGIATRLSLQPDSADAHHAAKVATLPANIIIGVLGPDGLPSSAPFAEVISEFLQSIHEQPRPWNALNQGAVRGERLVRALAAAGQMPPEHAADVIARDEYHKVTGAPNLIAARLLRAVTKSSASATVRKAILDDPERNYLTAKRKAQTVGPLLLTIYNDVPGRQKNAVATLNSEFLPNVLGDDSWTVRPDATLREVLEEALGQLDSSPGASSNAALELCARSIGALAALGLVYSDQGSQFPDPRDAWKRGPVAQVITRLTLCAGGLKVMCEAAERAEDPSALMPKLYTVDGEVVLGDDGQPEHLHPDHSANARLRELAFADQRPSDAGEDDDDEIRSPLDRFIGAQKAAVIALAQLEKAIVEDVWNVRNGSGVPVVDSEGLDRDIMEDVPARLSHLRDLVLLSLREEKELVGEGEQDEQAAYESLADDLFAEDVNSEVV